MRKLTEEMCTILDDIRQVRSRCEALLESAGASVALVQELGEPIVASGREVAAVATGLAGMEERLTAVERLNALFQALEGSRAAGAEPGKGECRNQPRRR